MRAHPTLICTLMIVFGLQSAWAAPIPAGTAVLSKDAIAAFKLTGSQQQLGKLEMIDVPDQSFTRALRIITAPGATAEWNVQLVAPTIADVKTDDVLLSHFWLRCADSMTGEGLISFEFESSQPDFTKAAELRVSASSQWKECFLPFRARRAFSTGNTQVTFRAGFDRQTMEIGGIEVTDLGTTIKLEDLPKTAVTYAGRAPDAPWRKEAADRIDKFRKGDLTILVTDSSGKPVPSAQIHVAMKRLAFGLGTCVTADHLTGTSDDDKRYQQIVAQYFNQAVFENDMKWYATWDGIPPKVDQAMDWLEAHHMTVRGHNLVWPSWKWSPAQLQAFEKDPVELGRRVDQHITDMVTHYRGRLFEWDVVNEVFANHELPDLLGGPSVMIHWFNLAHAADPACQLYINDYDIFNGPAINVHADAYYNTIKSLKDSGAPLNGIGIQSHFASDLPSPMHLMSVLDHFSELGLPIESTEISLDLTDRQLQADYLRDYATTLFSHPNVKGIMLWGFWAGRHWRPEGALYALDWTPRPVAQAWIDMVQKDWTTNTTLSTNDQGAAKIRGFCGLYDLTATAGSMSQTATGSLSTDGTKITIVLK
jgi:endo-1,4-beta-xylanase